MIDIGTAFKTYLNAKQSGEDRKYLLEQRELLGNQAVEDRGHLLKQREQAQTEYAQNLKDNEVDRDYLLEQRENKTRLEKIKESNKNRLASAREFEVLWKDASNSGDYGLVAKNIATDIENGRGVWGLGKEVANRGVKDMADGYFNTSSAKRVGEMIFNNTADEERKAKFERFIFQSNGDGTFTPMLVPKDGSEPVPATKFRTDKNSDIVKTLTQEQLVKIAGTIVKSAEFAENTLSHLATKNKGGFNRIQSLLNAEIAGLTAGDKKANKNKTHIKTNDHGDRTTMVNYNPETGEVNNVQNMDDNGNITKTSQAETKQPVSFEQKQENDTATAELNRFIRKNIADPVKRKKYIDIFDNYRQKMGDGNFNADLAQFKKDIASELDTPADEQKTPVKQDKSITIAEETKAVTVPERIMQNLNKQIKNIKNSQSKHPTKGEIKITKGMLKKAYPFNQYLKDNSMEKVKLDRSNRNNRKIKAEYHKQRSMQKQKYNQHINELQKKAVKNIKE